MNSRPEAPMKGELERGNFVLLLAKNTVQCKLKMRQVIFDDDEFNLLVKVASKATPTFLVTAEIVRFKSIQKKCIGIMPCPLEWVNGPCYRWHW